MRRRIVLLAPLAVAAAGPAFGAEFAVGDIEISDPWAKPSVSEAAALFVRLYNRGRRPDRLLGGATPIAERVILRELDGSPLEYLDLLPRRPVALRPGRRYIALRGLKRLLAVDDTFPLTLHFAAAGSVAVTAIVAEGEE